eukprot:1247864-Amphidinium_carterae.1
MPCSGGGVSAHLHPDPYPQSPSQDCLTALLVSVNLCQHSLSKTWHAKHIVLTRESRERGEAIGSNIVMRIDKSSMPEEPHEHWVLYSHMP